ncbi:D-alanyl-D-alanine carboxypeptidase, partial [Acinetobacter baumannii]|nr:D-alanyl-D-alanine carboxypeptidase [Acinetobacter baumannii]
VVTFDGKIPKACGPKTFNVISLGADEFLERLFRSYWEKDGRTWTGHVRRGDVPKDATMIAGHTSQALSDVTILVNKWS